MLTATATNNIMQMLNQHSQNIANDPAFESKNPVNLNDHIGQISSTPHPEWKAREERKASSSSSLPASSVSSTSSCLSTTLTGGCFSFIFSLPSLRTMFGGIPNTALNNDHAPTETTLDNTPLIPLTQQYQQP